MYKHTHTHVHTNTIVFLLCTCLAVYTLIRRNSMFMLGDENKNMKINKKFQCDLFVIDTCHGFAVPVVVYYGTWLTDEDKIKYAEKFYHWHFYGENFPIYGKNSLCTNPCVCVCVCLHVDAPCSRNWSKFQELKYSRSIKSACSKYWRLACYFKHLGKFVTARLISIVITMHVSTMTRKH